MEIRKYNSNDCRKIVELFYNTVHTINARDYSKQQLNVWAAKNVDVKKWNEKLLNNYTIVAVNNEIIVGFSNINNIGYIDYFYVHKDYQRKGIATQMLKVLEKYAIDNNVKIIFTHASITAVPFFISKGYNVIKKQSIKRKNEELINYVMEKYK